MVLICADTCIFKSEDFKWMYIDGDLARVEVTETRPFFLGKDYLPKIAAALKEATLRAPLIYIEGLCVFRLDCFSSATEVCNKTVILLKDYLYVTLEGHHVKTIYAAMEPYKNFFDEKTPSVPLADAQPENNKEPHTGGQFSTVSQPPNGRFMIGCAYLDE